MINHDITRKILFFQYKPAIRVYKMGKTLQNNGFEVHFSGSAKPFDYYNDQFPFHLVSSAAQLQELAAGYDVLIHANPNHRWCVEAAHPCRICAVGDIDSFRRQIPCHIEREQYTFNNFEGFIFISPEQRAFAIDYFKAKSIMDKSIILYNGILNEWLPRRKIVYSGNLRHDGALQHRNLLDVFKELAYKYDIHLYPGQIDYPDEYFRALPPGITIHQRISPFDLVTEFKQYDAGLIWFNIDDMTRKNLETALPNKLYEYLAAGLPVICQNLKAFNHYALMHQIYPVSSLDEIDKVFQDHFEVITYDNQYKALESILLKLLTH